MTDEQEEGHEAEEEEEPEEYLDKLFSREKIWSVVIGFAITNWLLHFAAIVWPTIPVSNHDDWLVVWAILTPLAVAGGMWWPKIERKYSGYFPWMD